jgi:hypothetical protein
MKKKLTALLLVLVVVFATAGTAMAQHRGGYYCGGHHGGHGINGWEALAIITGALVINDVIRSAVQPRQVVVYRQDQQQESGIVVETNEVPRYRVNSCFPEGKYLWNGAIVTDAYGQQIGSLPAGMKLNPGSCIRYR